MVIVEGGEDGFSMDEVGTPLDCWTSIGGAVS